MEILYRLTLIITGTSMSIHTISFPYNKQPFSLKQILVESTPKSINKSLNQCDSLILIAALPSAMLPSNLFISSNQIASNQKININKKKCDQIIKWKKIQVRILTGFAHPNLTTRCVSETKSYSL